MPQISLIVVNWNTGGLLAKCLNSVANLPEQELIHHVIVIDNASHDTSAQRVKIFAREHTYVIVQEQDNLGFAKANNAAWNYIRKHGGDDDHILLLNPDTEIHPGTLRAMLDILERNPHAGIVGPKLIASNGDTQMSVREFPTTGVFILLFLKIQRVFSGSAFWKKYMMASFNYEKEQQVDQVMGAAFLIRNTVLHTIGLLDEAFWIWFEEVDYSKRALDAGWSTIYTPQATVLHHGGVSFGQRIGLAKTKPLLDSSLVYAKKHLGNTAYGVLLFLYPFALGVAMIATFAHVKQKRMNGKRL